MHNYSYHRQSLDTPVKHTHVQGQGTLQSVCHEKVYRKHLCLNLITCPLHRQTRKQVYRKSYIAPSNFAHRVIKKLVSEGKELNVQPNSTSADSDQYVPTRTLLIIIKHYLHHSKVHSQLHINNTQNSRAITS